MNKLLDWQLITAIINAHYNKGKTATGKPCYSVLLLFKMSLLQTWYGLSDYKIEDHVNDSNSLSYFCGLNINQVAPYHSTRSRFTTIMTQAKAFQTLFNPHYS